MRRWVMRTLSKVCSYIAVGVSFFEGRGWYRSSEIITKGYRLVDDLHWKLTQRNIRRLRDKQRRLRDKQRSRT